MTNGWSDEYERLQRNDYGDPFGDLRDECPGSGTLRHLWYTSGFQDARGLRPAKAPFRLSQVTCRLGIHLAGTHVNEAQRKPRMRQRHSTTPEPPGMPVPVQGDNPEAFGKVNKSTTSRPTGGLTGRW